MHRIVHLDLKGAPIKVPYLEKILIAAKQWGATGVLLEWEDTFPYSAELADIGSQGRRSEDGQAPRVDQGGSGGDGMYTVEEVKHILQFAKDISIEAIQLIQTIGHMEFVLKHQAFRGLREVPRSPTALCPSRPEAQVLVRAMLDQALSFQPHARFLHIGADEVWHTGVCDLCQKRASLTEHKTASLYLDHIRDLASYVKQNRPQLTVLMWDDMLRSISCDTLKAFNLTDLVAPVVWNYNPEETFKVDPELWNVYRQLFPTVWAGSAFKGANGGSRVMSPVIRYVSNHEAWLKEITKYQQHINFAGIILTGWSRFDHYATLCELLPVSLPSLASCLRVLNKDGSNADSAAVCDVLPGDQWPGEELARCIHSFVILRERCLAFLHGDLLTTWFNPWQIEHNFSNPMQVDALAANAKQLSSELSSLTAQLSSHFIAITGKRSREEWVHTFITPISSRLTDITTKAEMRTKMDASVMPTGY